jgi:hypothetical protein
MHACSGGRAAILMVRPLTAHSHVGGTEPAQFFSTSEGSWDGPKGTLSIDLGPFAPSHSSESTERPRDEAPPGEFPVPSPVLRLLINELRHTRTHCFVA